MPDNEFPPLPLERLQTLTDPTRNGPLVVSMARELIALRAERVVLLAGVKTLLEATR